MRGSEPFSETEEGRWQKEWIYKDPKVAKGLANSIPKQRPRVARA